MKCIHKNNGSVSITCGLFCLLVSALFCEAGADLEGKACRSVHLQYRSQECDRFYNEVEVVESYEGSFFMVCGWDVGYFGLQELSNGKKVIIFSVWDAHKGHDPNAVSEDRRVKLLHKDPAVRAGRFGGEGTGGQSFFGFRWQKGQTYRFYVESQVNGERTEYSGYFYLPRQKRWKHLVTFSTLNGRHEMRGSHSFVEDFRRNRISATKVHKANFGPAWVRKIEGGWKFISNAKFTADGNPATNINAGRTGRRFFLSTGGDVKNSDTKLWGHINLPETERQPPEDLP